MVKCSVVAESTRDYCVLGCKRDGVDIVAPVCSGEKLLENREMRCRREFVKERRALLWYRMFELPVTPFLQEFMKSYFETKEETVQSIYICKWSLKQGHSFISFVLAREREQCKVSRKWGLTCQRAAGRRAEFLDSASREFPDVTNICASRVVKMPFTHLLRSGRPQVDPQAGNVTDFSSWVRELLCGQKLRLWVTSPGWL